MRFDADVAVIGGGPAGLAAAIGARGLGLRVVLMDARRPPIDKACGEGLLPGAMAAAEALGLELPVERAGVIRGIRFVRGAASVEADFGTPSYGIRRTKLSEALVGQACRAGVDLQWGVPVTGVDGHVVRTGAGEMRARWIVGADGERSWVRRAVGLDCEGEHTRYAFRMHSAVGWGDKVEVHWGERCQAYVTPAGEGGTGIAVISDSSQGRVAEVAGRFPALKRLLEAPVLSMERGAVTTVRRLPRVTRGPVALVGDASGSVDAITGEGIGLAFRQAVLLREALRAEDLGRYEAGHRALSRGVRWMERILLTCAASDVAAGVAMGTLVRAPWLFRGLSALHLEASG